MRGTLVGGAAFLGGTVVLGNSHSFAATSSDRVKQAQPSVATRADWGSRSTPAPEVLATPPNYIVVHHTATANSTDYSQEHAFALSRSIQAHHMDTNGWPDTGQQLTISRGGHVMEGRNRSLPAIERGEHVVGAHVANYNSEAVGIENEGTYTSAEPTGDLWDALVETVAWLVAQYGVSPDNIVGHRDLGSTACPGDVLYSMLPELRNQVAAAVADLGVSDSDLRTTRLPAAPDVPGGGPERDFEHGPALGRDDPNFAAES